MKSDILMAAIVGLILGAPFVGAQIKADLASTSTPISISSPALDPIKKSYQDAVQSAQLSQAAQDLLKAEDCSCVHKFLDGLSKDAQIKAYQYNLNVLNQRYQLNVPKDWGLDTQTWTFKPPVAQAQTNTSK